MSRVSAKVAISVEPTLLARAERLRKVTGESRSALVGRALRLLLRDEGRTRAVKEYVEAYQRMPETGDDVRQARVTSMRALTTLPWDDE